MAQDTYLAVPRSNGPSRSASPPADVNLGSSSLPRTQVYPKRFPVLNSDTAHKSPWSSKLLLSLDGGGVRGYSSLLIIQRLLTIVAALEKGPGGLIEDTELPWPTCSSSSDYPWYRDVRSNMPERIRHSLEANQTVDAANDNTPEHDETQRGDIGPSNVTQSHLSERADATPDSESSSGATRKHAWPSPSQSANIQEDDLCKFRVHHYFDYVAGTSTGGLSALMLSRLKMSVDEALLQYSTVGNGVFARPRPPIISIGGILKPKYESKKMIEALKKVIKYGSKKETRRTKHSDIRLRNENTDACHTAVVAFGGSKVRRPYVFRTYVCPEDTHGRRYDGDNKSMARIWEVARATSAAPFYFSRQEIDGKTFIDGGVGCNNPSERMYSEIRAVHGNSPDLILSIGTGIDTASSRASEENDDTPEIVNTDGNKRHRYFDNARSILKTARGLAHIVADSQDVHEKLESDCHSARSNGKKYPMYFRFNVPGITSAVGLDQWNDSKDAKSPNGIETLRRLEQATKDYLDDPDVTKSLQECAGELVRVRRARAKTERWERFATHTVYQCPLRDVCGSPQFPSREKLRMHASERHQFVPRVMIGSKPVCLIDQCMETPQLHDDDEEFEKHLKEADHDLQDAIPMSTSDLEAWLDGGRQTEDAVLARQQNGMVGGPSAANDPSVKKGRTYLPAFLGRKRRAPSTPSEQNVSMSDSQ